MAFCVKCGSEVKDDDQYCAKCGFKVVDAKPNADQSDSSEKQTPPKRKEPSFFQGILNTNDHTQEFDPKDIADNRAMAVLSYIWALVFIPWFAASNSPYARFHAKQGMNLFIFETVYAALVGVISISLRLTIGWFLQIVYNVIIAILNIFTLVFIALCIIGIINCIAGKARELPLIQDFKLIK